MKAIKNLLVVFFCLVLTKINAQSAAAEVDTALKTKPIHAWHIKSTARIHTKGMFLYGGRISSTNPALDVNFIYSRPKWGFMIYKAIDITDHTTGNNFTLATFFKNFKVSERLTITPYAGTFLEQAHSFADWGSDIVALAIINYKMNPTPNVDYTTLLPNLVVEPELRDWINRFRLLYTNKHWDVTGSFWNNNKVFDQASHVSAAITLGYSRVKLNDSFNVSISATEFAVLQTSNEIETPKGHTFMLTAAVQFAK